MTTLRDLVTLRPMREGDLNFIRSSWLKSGARTMRGIVSQETYYAIAWEVVMGLLDRPRARTLVACERRPHGAECECEVCEAADDQLVGWACAEPGEADRRAVAHYCYVKHPFRGQGIARLLMEAALDGGRVTGVLATALPTEDMRRKLEAMAWTFRPQAAPFLAAEGTTEAA